GGLLSDAACCVVKDGHLVSAVEQSKVSHWNRHSQFPNEAFSAALETAGVEPAEIECVAIARQFAQGSESDAQLELRSRFPRSAIVLSVDRAGDFRSAVLFEASGNRLTPVRELYFPDSLGDLFNRVTALLGYAPRGDEHKVQWLSTSGEPAEHKLFIDLLHRNGLRWPQIDRGYLDASRLTQGGFSRRFYDAIGLSPNERISAAKQASVAASLQEAINETVASMLGDTRQVCIAGGLALNALLIASLERKFPKVFVQPAAGNAGTALGAVLHA